MKAWLKPTANEDEGKQVPLSWSGASVSAPPEIEAEFIIDGRHDTGWVIFGKEGERHTAVLTFAEPVTIEPKQNLVIQLSHENYYPAGMGRFRISATSDDGDLKATGLPTRQPKLC